MRLHAIVEEKEDPVFVANISESEYEDLGEFGLELLAKEWCEKKGYTFVDIAI